MPKRPATAARSESPASSVSSAASSRPSAKSPTRKRPRVRSKSSSAGSPPDESGTPHKVLKVHIVQEKLDDKSIHELFDSVERHTDPSAVLALELCSDVQDADIIITGIRMKHRLQRHVNWKIAKQKPIVTPDWLRESVKEGRPVECGDFAALRELHDETVEHCPDNDTNESTLVASSESSSSPSASPSKSKHQAPSVKPTNPRVFDQWRSRYACQRASPLVCPNQALAAELGILNRARDLEGNNMSALSYEKSVAIIKSYPYPITKETYERDIVKLPGLGDKTLLKIKEFMRNGYIKEARETQESERFQSLSTFTSVYGIGPTTARMLYERGLRTLTDLERYYDVTPNSLEQEVITTPNGQRIPTALETMLGLSASGKPTKKKDKLPDMTIQIALALREDFAIPIPRAEVEETHRVVMAELDKIQPGCTSTVVGGYRRGKSESNDVDIVITHSDLENGEGIIKGLCTKFTKHLHTRGMVTQVMHLSGFHAHNALRTGHWDSLEKALTVFKLPPGDENERRIYRRLDLIFASPAAYWTAVVGWTGSKLFERDLRSWAKREKGMKFDSSGLTRRHNSALFAPHSEEEVFEILGLDWIDPTMRNANV